MRTNVLVVFNHLVGPLPDRRGKHQFWSTSFCNQRQLSACAGTERLAQLERTGSAAAGRTVNMLLISGGDRHGVEPNANINLTNAVNFTEFVHESGGRR